MAVSFRKILEGLRIVPKTTSSVSEKGDLDVTSGNGKLNYHNGTSTSPIVTETHQATLTNKTLTSPVLNTPTSDTITGITGAALTVQSATDENLILDAQGIGTVSVKDVDFSGGGTISTGAAGLDLIATAGPIGITSITSDVSIVSQNSASRIVIRNQLLQNNINFESGFDSSSGANQTIGAIAPSIVLTSPSLTSISGFSTVAGYPAFTSGDIRLLTNNTGSTVLINDQASTSGNQIVTGTNGPVPLLDKSSMLFVCISVASTLKWFIIGNPYQNVSPLQTISTNTTLTNSNSSVLVNASSGSVTATLPSPVKGKILTIKKTDSSANSVIISAPSGTIDGSSTRTLTAQYDSVTITSDGTNFFII